jgi:hypothetical protein
MKLDTTFHCWHKLINPLPYQQDDEICCWCGYYWSPLDTVAAVDASGKHGMFEPGRIRVPSEVRPIEGCIRRKR